MGESDIDLRTYLRVVLKHYKLILLGTVLAALTALVIKVFVIPPAYEATSTVLITQTRLRISFDPNFQTLEDSDVRSYAALQQAHRASLVALVRSGAIARIVADRLADETGEAVQNPSKLLNRVSASLGGKATSQNSSANVIGITVTAEDPDLATRIANLWAETYVSNVNELYSRPPESYNSVQRQVLTTEQTYQKAQEMLQLFLIDSPLDLLQLRIKDIEHLIDEQMDDRQRTLTNRYSTKRRMQRLLGDATALHDQLQSSGAEGASTISLSILMLKAEVFSGSDDLPIELQLQVETMGEAVDTAAQKADLEVLKGVIEARILELETAIGEALSTPLPGAIDKLQEELRQLHSDLEQESALKQELVSSRDLAWETHSTLQMKAAELGIAAEMEDVEVVFASPAVNPLKPTERGILMSVGLAAVLGCILGILIVFGFHYLGDEEDRL